MTRTLAPFAYSDATRAGCYWPTTVQMPEYPALAGPHDTEIAVIGAGFTGLNAALKLAKDGTRVTVLDAKQPGWGASGRNGGFCCLGGGILDNAQLDKHFGTDARRTWRQTEIAAITHVKTLLAAHKIDADTHSQGETQLAHSPSSWTKMQKDAAQIHDSYGVIPEIIAPQDLKTQGFGDVFHGAVTTPLGFALNPAKYTAGLAKTAQNLGAQIHGDTPVTRIEQGAQFTLHTPAGKITAKRIIVATNGYSADDLPSWLAARYLPVQSSVLVTRPLTQSELDAAGWTSDQMCFDSRNLLHYFRLMPNRQFLFGMRGGIFASPRNDRKIKTLIRKHFEQMFPAWAQVDTPFYWSGLVCLGGKGLPFTGEIPQMPGAFASLSYHGNGVAMASYCGALLADLVQDKPSNGPFPSALRAQPSKFPLGSKRRWLLPPAYGLMTLKDRFL